MSLLSEEHAEPIVAMGGPPWGALALVVVALLALPLLGVLARKIVPGEEDTRIHWGAPHIAVVVMATIAAMLLTGLFVSSDDSATKLLCASAAALALPATLATVFAAKFGPNGLAALGVRAGRLFRAPLAALVLYVLIMPAMSALQFVWVWILSLAGRETFEQPLIEILSKVPPDERLVPVVIGAVVQPLFEEILFRGFLQPVLVRKLRPVGGIALTSLLFAGMHGVEGLAPIFALSCLLGYVMLRTQRLHAVWFIHAVHNGLQFLMLYVFPELLQRASQPNLITP
ncbi:MAG: CPBP family intramembrane metalloprotease [Planctomycetes bacterium]|nr:CPBP family intramembrane metalloprotease [Planctomycetota bacterium]